MKALNIDFVPRRRPARWMWWAVSAVAAAAGLLHGLALYEKAKAAQLTAEIERLRAAPAAGLSVAAPAVSPAPYDISARQMMAERMAAWPAALRALEVTQVAGVQVVGVEVLASEQRIRVDVQYDDMSQLLRYVAELNQGEPIPRWKMDRARSSERSGSQSTGSLSATLTPHS